MNLATIGALSAVTVRRDIALKLNLQNILLFLKVLVPNYSNKEKDGIYFVYNARYLYFVGEKIIVRYGTTTNPNKLLKKGNKWLIKRKLDKKFSKLGNEKVCITSSSFDYRQIKSYLEGAIDMGNNGLKGILIKLDKQEGGKVTKLGKAIDQDFARVSAIVKKRGRIR